MKKVAARANKPRKAKPAAPSAQEAVHASSQAPVNLKRLSKGKRAQFYDHVAVDQLFAVATALTAELSVAFDRLDTLERVLTTAGVVTADKIEDYRPADDAAAVRAHRREELIQRVFAVFDSYATPPDT